MPPKNTEDSIDKEVEYCEKLIKIVEEMPVMPNLPAVKEKLNLLKETMNNTKEELYKSKDEDGKELEGLVEKSRKAGIEVEAVIGDAAYSGKDNIKLAGQKENDGFVYNKDADMIQCKVGCYKDGAKSKTVSMSLKCEEYQRQKEFQESDTFKNLSKERYKIEAKNSELKNVHGYDISVGNGLYGTKIQGVCAIFVTNLKRITFLMEIKAQKEQKAD